MAEFVRIRDEPILSCIKAVYEADTLDFLTLVEISGLDKTRDFINADLSGVDVSNLDLRGFRFDGCLFRNSDLRGTNLADTGFEFSNATGARLDSKTILEVANSDLQQDLTSNSLPGEILLQNIIGSPVTGDGFFWPRPEVVERLVRDLLNGRNCVVVGPRRIGKSSVLLEVYRQLHSKILLGR